MAGKKLAGENNKKVVGNARKAETAAQKKAEENARKGKQEEEEWNKGAKSSAKKDAIEVKKAEALRKKAETAALLAEEEKALKGAKTGNAKSANKKTRDDNGGSKPAGTLDLAQLDEDDDQQATPLKASGIDNALDALSLTATPANGGQVDRHPERRYKTAYTAYEARRLPEIEEENKGLRRQQRLEMVRKEFDKSPENPFNQVNARFDMSKDELKQIKLEERRKVEERLTSG